MGQFHRGFCAAYDKNSYFSIFQEFAKSGESDRILCNHIKQTDKGNLMMEKKVIVRTAMVGMLVYLVVSCSSSEDSKIVAEKIGKEGGAISTPEGSELKVPEDALTDSVELSIHKTDSGSPKVPDEYSPAGDTFAFLPHGQTFDVSVTVTVPFTPVDGKNPKLLTAPENGSWSIMESARVEGKTMIVEVDHFSFFMVATAKTGVSENLDGVWKFTSSLCDGQAKEIGNTTWHIAGNSGTVISRPGQDCVVIIPVTHSYPSANQMNWTTSTLIGAPIGCVNIDSTNNSNIQHEGAWLLDGTTLTLTEELTPEEEFACPSKKQVTTLTRLADSVAGASAFTGKWKGSVEVKMEDGEEEEDSAMAVSFELTAEGNQVTGKFWEDETPDNKSDITGSVKDGVYYYDQSVSNSDAGHEDCVGDKWNVSGVMLLNTALDKIDVFAGGVFCRKAGSYIGTLTKQ